MKNNMTQIHTTTATGTDKPGRRVRFRTKHEACCEAAFTAVQQAISAVGDEDRIRRVTGGT